MKEKERDFEQYLNDSDSKARELEKQIKKLTKLLGKNFVKLVIDLPRIYRSVENEADLSDLTISEFSDSESEIIETEQKLVVPQKKKKILLKPSQFQVETKEEAIEQAAAFEASTPLTANKGEHRAKF